MVPGTKKGEVVMENIHGHDGHTEGQYGHSGKSQIRIFVNRRRLEVDQTELSGEQKLMGLGMMATINQILDD
jgi:hypothetical protein